MWKNRLFISIVLLLVIHLVGLFGFIIAPDKFVHLTALNLMFSAFIILINNQNRKIKHFTYLVFIGITGYLVEVIGIQSHLIFGTYEYGSTLGFKLFDVPLLMSLNWVVPIYCVGMVCNYFPWNNFVKALLGAILMTTFDILLEPVAIGFDYWNWINAEIPVQNYCAWFVISFLFLLGFNYIDFNKENKTAAILFSTQLLFFSGLNVFALNNTHSWYFLVNLFTVFFPFVRSFENKLQFVGQWKSALFAIGCVALPFILWDILFTHLGVWGFNETYLIGIKIFNLPIEEMLFFITIPFACLFIHANTCKFLIIKSSNLFININTIIYSLIAVYILYNNPLGYYSLSVGLLVLFWLGVNWKYNNAENLQALFISFCLTLIPFTLVNGLLTGSFIGEPIVWYNDNHNAHIRALNIPIEDFLYCLLLIGLTINLKTYITNRYSKHSLK